MNAAACRNKRCGIYWGGRYPEPFARKTAASPNSLASPPAMDPTGELLIRWTIRLAMLCFAVVLGGAVISRRPPASTILSRWTWTVGCGLFLAHVISAFEFYHGWSHAHAFQDTAEKTAAAIGWRFGGGIYVNHLFALVWTADVLWSWLAPNSYRRRPAWATAMLIGFMLFIAVNGLIVFKSGAVRWVSITALCTLLALWGAMLWVRIRGRSEMSVTALRSE